MKNTTTHCEYVYGGDPSVMQSSDCNSVDSGYSYTVISDPIAVLSCGLFLFLGVFALFVFYFRTRK